MVPERSSMVTGTSCPTETATHRPSFDEKSCVECSAAVRRVSTIAGHGLDLDAGGGEELPDLRGVLYDV